MLWKGTSVGRSLLTMSRVRLWDVLRKRRFVRIIPTSSTGNDQQSQKQPRGEARQGCQGGPEVWPGQAVRHAGDSRLERVGPGRSGMELEERDSSTFVSCLLGECGGEGRGQWLERQVVSESQGDQADTCVVSRS